MIVEERYYGIRPGKVAAFVAAYGEHGLPLQVAFLGAPVGYITSETGELNHVVSLWRYEDLNDRTERRRRMLANPRWQAYLDRVTDLIDIQQTRMLVPTTFSAIR